MEKLIFITLLFLSSFQTIRAQESNELGIIISGKWHLEYIEMSGQKMDLPAEMQENIWVVFHADGKHEGMEEGRSYQGTWEYDPSTKIIRTDDLDGKVEQKLISIDQHKFVVSVTNQGEEMIMGMRK